LTPSAADRHDAGMRGSRARPARNGLATLVAGALVIACSGAGPLATSNGSPAVGSPLRVDSQPPASGRPVLIDTDMAADDWMAILFLLWRRDVDVKAITVTGTGEAHCDSGVRNALGLLALAGRPEIPVACGRDTPIAGTHAFPAEWRLGVDQLFGLALPQNLNKASPGSAVDLLGATLRSSTEPVTILALGPLTNLAELLRGATDLKGRISGVFVMGGAVDVPGNVYGPDLPQQSVTEWNVYIDPTAAKLVLASGVPVTLVALDATNHLPVTAAFATRAATEARTSSARFVGEVLGKQGESIARGDYFFWDPFAAAVLVDESITSFARRHLDVVAEEGPESGHIVAAAQGAEIRFAISGAQAKFEDLFLQTLNGGSG
jgi:inosine-uridine nucleoside N-ribohydrolase